jgi:hypothetical protein
MPDITMCPSTTCSAKTKCYRNRASGTISSEYRQSWFVESPAKSDDPVICDYYWPLK